MKKLFNTKSVLAAVTACIALVSTGCSVDVKLTPEEQGKVNEIISQFGEIASASDIKVNLNNSDYTITGGHNQENKGESNDEAVMSDDEYRNTLLEYFKENAETFTAAYFLSSFGTTIQRGNDEIVWYNTDTNEIYWCGDAAQENEIVDYTVHGKSNVARNLNDSRFSDSEEYNAYLRTIFTENYLAHESCGRNRFIEYNGKTYVSDIKAGLLFDGWYADRAEVTEFKKDKSFTVFVPGMEFENCPDETLYGTIKFVSTDNGWRIDSIGYNNYTNTRFK